LRDPSRFRQDLLYRINTIEIRVPPLRARVDDIPLIAAHYVALYTRKYGKATLPLGSAALARLKLYPWPGNVRELKHAIERMVILSDGDVLSLDAIPSIAGTAGLGVPAASGGDATNLNLEEHEKQVIQRAIAQHHGNLSKAAQSLGLGRTTLYRKMARYGLQ
jgi:DNA-binding NtrC family response regulator